MAIPTILSGAAGRALETLQPLAGMARHVDDVASGVARFNGSVADALTWAPSVSPTVGTGIINAAGDDLVRALGRVGKREYSATLHAAHQNLQGSIGAVGRAASPDEWNVGMRGVQSGARDILAGIDQLSELAASTARRRVIIGSLAVGGGIAGLAALGRAGGHDSQPMAPGPIGEPAKPRGELV